MKAATNFIKLTDSPFSRRGSYFAFFPESGGSDVFGKAILWLSNTRGGGATMGSVVYRQLRLELYKDGHKLASQVSTTPYEVILESNYGSVRFCIGERRLVRLKGDDGLTLRMSPQSTTSHLPPSITNMLDGTYLVPFGQSNVLLIPFKGKLSCGMFYEISPDENGCIEMAVEEYTIDPVRRPFGAYPSYEQCYMSCKAEFDEFAAKVAPVLPERYESMRLQAAWLTWTLMVEPDGEAIYRHTMVKMLRGLFEHISGWQQAMQAICLSNDIKLAWDILISCFDYQDANGRIADILDNEAAAKNAMKPPFQGCALLWLMENRDLSGIDINEKKKMYKGMKRWTEFFLNCRDLDKDGLWENRSAGETGWEDAPYFYVGFPLASPDMNAYLALQMEALSRLGTELGEPDAAEWMNKSKQLVDTIVKTFWTGERWTAFNAVTKQRAVTESLPLYAALILGKRLPQEIIDKSIDYIFAEGTFETQFGLATESLKSIYFTGGWTQGSIVTPAHIIFCMAFEACGRPELAKRIALKYADLLKARGFYHFHNAITGEGEYQQSFGNEKVMYWSAWASSCYLFLADRYGR
jgi:hypothetical protein